MTSCTAVDYASVVKFGASKSCGVMAHGAIFRGGDMAAALDGCYCARTVVAGGAVIHDTGMIEHRVGKSAGNVTDTAILGGRDVACILLGHRTRSTITVTFCAVINPAGMIKSRISEIYGVMADTAVLAVRSRMSCGHSPGAGCNITRTAVMARGTITGDA